MGCRVYQIPAHYRCICGNQCNYYAAETTFQARGQASTVSFMGVYFTCVYQLENEIPSAAWVVLARFHGPVWIGVRRLCTFLSMCFSYRFSMFFYFYILLFSFYFLKHMSKFLNTCCKFFIYIKNIFSYIFNNFQIHN